MLNIFKNFFSWITSFWSTIPEESRKKILDICYDLWTEILGKIYDNHKKAAN